MEIISLSLYLKCFAAAFLGLLIHTGLKLKSLKELATKSNVEFKTIDYFTQDWISHTINIICIALWMMWISDIIAVYPGVTMILTVLSSVVGYFNTSIIISIFSVMKGRINKVIDVKTTVADTMQGTLNTPTTITKKQ